MKLILVEYKESFELFEDIVEAFNFCKKIKNVERIDLVDVNENNIYYDEVNGKKNLNYEDNSELIKQGILSDFY